MLFSTRWLQKHLHTLFIIGLPFGLLVILFRSLLFQMSTALFDWNDYPLYIWIMYQNIDHLVQLDFSHFFNGNIFYPSQNTLLFSDLFLPQSLLALPLTFVIHNPVLVFNLIFFVTLLLNVVSARYLWSAFFSKWWQLLSATTITVISSFIFQNWYHFQILSLWPFLLTLGFFFKSDHSWKRAAIGGVLLSVLLHASVYYWIFAVTVLSVWYLFQLIYSSSKKKTLFAIVKFTIICLSVFILLSSVTLFQYWHTRQMYNAQRQYHEYVTYAAHSSDYFFPAHMSSALWGTKIVRQWNQFNKHSGVFPGITVSVLAIIGLCVITKKKNVTVGVDLTKETSFFLLLTIMGLLFSLGPRLSFNGVYLALPLPYHLLLKSGPFFEVVRVTSRWSLLMFLGLTYFATAGLAKISKRFAVVMTVTALALYILEVYPLSWQFYSQSFYPKINSVLVEQCKTQPKVLLEYPLTQYKPDITIVTNLTYRTQMMLASTKHHCILINGYSGFIPKDYEQFEYDLFWSVQNRNKELFIELIGQLGVSLIKLNRTELYEHHAAVIDEWLQQNSMFSVIHNEENFLIVSYGKN